MHNGLDANVADLWALASRDAMTRLTELARRALRAPTALISTFTPDMQQIESASGLTGASAESGLVPLPCSMCRHVFLANAPILANAVAHHYDLRDIVQTGDAPIVAYVGVPIQDATGTAVGTLCVQDVRQRDWDEHDIALLKELALSSMAQISLKVEAISRQRAETALRDSESRLVAVTDNIPGLVFERRKVGHSGSQYTFFGSAKQTLPGVREIMAGNPDSLNFIHADDRERVHAEIERSTIAETDLDLTFRVVGEPPRWLRSQSVVRRDTDGTALWDGICSDISDLVAAREAAEAARLVKDTLLVDVNHELRTPLQAIIGFTDLLRTETRLDVVRTHALSIQNAGHALLSIVNQLLDLAGSAEGATAPSEPAATNIKLLAEACHDMVAPLAAEKGILSYLLVDADLPPLFHADGPKIQQVIVNLLNNAIKFTEAGSVTLHVSRDEGRLRFSVSDTGIGIPKDKIELLFHRFSRIEPDRRSIRGTGLGLAIAKRLVESMDGTIGVTSTPDLGTTFWFEVRVKTLDEPAQDPTLAATFEPETPVSGARILIADDLDLNRKLIADMLSIDGHETDCVTDGAAAVRAAGERRYDLILMDMIMPVMDGIAATRAIRALPAPACDVPIIALTAHSFKEQLDSCLAAGMDATLTKPMSIDVLMATVRSWTQGRSKAA